MMSLEAIQEVSRVHAAAAASAGRFPFTFESEDLDNLECLRNIPFLGTHLSPGWKRLDITTKGYVHGLYDGDNDGHGAWFVSTGWGEPGEPALIPEEFLKVIVAGHSYGIVEEGQFQIKIGEFERV